MIERTALMIMKEFEGISDMPMNLIVMGSAWYMIEERCYS